MRQSFLTRSLKIAALCGIAGVIVVLGVTLARHTTPYSAYKPWFGHNELAIRPFESSHYSNVELELRQLFATVTDPKERSILAATHWLLGFADDDGNFSYVFTDLVLALHELTYTNHSPVRAALGRELVRISLERALPMLETMFASNKAGQWDFISLLPMLADYPAMERAYHRFYREHFAGLVVNAYAHPGGSFADALRARDYAVIGDYLIDVSFLHYFLAEADSRSLPLPPNTFPQLLEQLAQFDYALPPTDQLEDFFDLAYLATHVILVLTNYGELELQEGNDNAANVTRYLDKTYHRVRYELGDLDLLAEYLQCFRLISGPVQDLRVAELEQFMLSLQRSDGSWGRRTDFSGDPYEKFHPTWAVLSALNEESLGMQ